MIFSGSEARGGLARESGNSAFSGLRISILFSFVTWLPIDIPAPSIGESPLLRSIYSLFLFWRMAILPCVRGLALAALIGTHLTVMLSIFYVRYALLDAFLVKYSFRSLASYSVGLVFFFLIILFIELYELSACFLDKFWVFIFGCKLLFFPMLHVAFLFLGFSLRGNSFSGYWGPFCWVRSYCSLF